MLHIREDFVVVGKTIADHDKALKAFLMRFKECGLTFNPRKCVIGTSEIEFFGLRFTSKGISPAPSKVEAIRRMERPQNVGEVRSLLGMAQYSAQFIQGFTHTQRC